MHLYVVGGAGPGGYTLMHACVRGVCEGGGGATPLHVWVGSKL